VNAATREKARIDSDEPSATFCITLTRSVEPAVYSPKHEQLEPTRTKLRTLMLDPT
jgi:hypothetical protein